ncbi:MAG TPA: hypothetical protein VI521_00180 [Candidatus Babeliales bacterium]|nr:hypothetical protein [Candidatus Babeliales bacterium]
MELLNKMQIYLNSMDQKRFYQYLIGILCAVAVLLALLFFYYYRTISRLKSQAIAINELRIEEKSILDTAQRIKKDQKEINAVLAQDKNFKIAEYFEDLIGKLGLAQKKLSTEVSTASPEGHYQESILQARFTVLSMKEVTELLQEIELNKRVFIKELDIASSKKQANSIDVTLIIATLEPKQQETGESTE